MATCNRLDKLESDPRVLNASFSPLSLSEQAFMSRERADPLRHESAVALQFQSQSQCLQQCNSHCSVDHVHVHVSQNSSEGISASTAVSATSSNTMLPPAIVRRVNDNEQKSSSLLHGHTQFALRENISNNQANLASARLRALAPLPLAHANTHITVDANGHPLSANSSVANRSFIDQNQAQTVSLTFIDEQTNTNHSNNNYPRMPSPSHAPVTPNMALVTPAVPPLPIQHFHHSHSHSHPYRPSSRSSKCFSSLAAQSPRAAQVAAGGPLPPTPQLTSSRSESLASNGFSPERSTTDTMTTANTATSMSPSPSPLSSPEFSACSCPSPEPALQSPSRLSLCSTSLSFPAYHSFSSLYAPILSSICHFLAPRDIASRVRSVSCHWRSVSFSPLSWRCAVLRVKSLDDLMNCLDAKKVPAMRALTVTLDTDMEVALEKMDQSITQLRAGLKTPLMRGVSECGSASAIQQSGVRTGLLSLKVLTLNDCSFVSPMALSHLRAFQHVQSLSFGRLDKASCEALFLALASFDFPYLNSLSISNSSLSLSSAHVCLRWHNTAPMLKTLSLEDVKGVGRALGVLAHLKGIETLKLAWNEDVTDASIASLIHPPPPPAIDTKNGTAPFSPPGSPMLLAGAHRQSLSATNNANINADANNGVNDANQSQQEPPAAGVSPVLAPAALYHSPLLNLRRDRRQLSSQDVCAPSLSLSLRTLDLQTCKNLTSAAMEHIAKLPDLTDLDVGGTAIGNDGLGFLAIGNLVHTLIRLNLTHCENVSCEGLKHISKFKVLQELYLEKTSIRDRGIKFLCTHHAMMHRVDPNRSPISAYKRSPSFSAAAAQQAASSPMCGSVTSPSCSSASSLPVLPFLHTLDLSCTMVTSASFAALSLLPALRSLNLSSTRLSSLYASAALAPSRFLCRFTTLTSLNVNWCMQLNVLDIFFLVSHLPALIQINQSTFRPRAESEEEKRHRRERLLDHEEDVEDDESDEEDSDEGNSDVDSDSRSSDLFSDDPFGDDALNSQSNGSADTVVVKVPVNSLSKKIDRLMRKRRRIGAEKLIARAKARFQFHSLPSLPASPFFGAQTPTFNGVPSPLHSPTHSAVAGHSLNYSFSSNSAIPLLAM